MYRVKQIRKQFYVIKDGDKDPFDGPMSQDEAILLAENCNSVPDEDENESSPIIREMGIRVKRINYFLNGVVE